MKARRIAIAALALSTVAASGRTLFADSKDWVAPAAEKAKVNPIKKDDMAALDAGRKTYVAKCQTCHGPKGHGDGKAAGYLQVKPENLTEEDVQAETDGELAWRIATGKKPMPAFGGKLSADEIWQVVSFVRELGASAVSPAHDSKPAPAPAPEPKKGD